MAKMADSVDERCLRCGAPDTGERARCVCGASLLVDVVLKDAVRDERQRFTLAGPCTARSSGAFLLAGPHGAGDSG
ncbi:hypothetical protein JY651_50855 [Pyxidicoccus parkwayensis]|uniref:Threonine synthase n=1 Tax=Pyxidicoccus parkwayensis TaxID=2813578 RepID=A0ABX7NY20_9BACT|nr:hypothetical protein [Pyxidicoccus parkwaysis]QSQ23289.1 hypothetical protein JY651_50855 [Pyxidicoccus parkwaysis]